MGSTTDGTIFKGNVTSGEVEVFSSGVLDDRTQANRMKVDVQGRLFVPGSETESIFVYDTNTAALLNNFCKLPIRIYIQTPDLEQTPPAIY